MEEYVEYTDSTEGYTEGQTEGKTEGQTEGQTEGKTEAKTEGKTGSTGVQLPSDHRVGNSYEDPTEAKTTHKTTTTIKNSNIKVTTTTKTHTNGTAILSDFFIYNLIPFLKYFCFCLSII